MSVASAISSATESSFPCRKKPIRPPSWNWLDSLINSLKCSAEALRIAKQRTEWTELDAGEVPTWGELQIFIPYASISLLRGERCSKDSNNLVFHNRFQPLIVYYSAKSTNVLDWAKRKILTFLNTYEMSNFVTVTKTAKAAASTDSYSAWCTRRSLFCYMNNFFYLNITIIHREV